MLLVQFGTHMVECGDVICGSSSSMSNTEVCIYYAIYYVISPTALVNLGTFLFYVFWLRYYVGY